MLAVGAVHADAFAVQSGAMRGVDEEFLELICADEELLRAEFDAIVAQEWSSSPPPADPPAAPLGPDPGPRPHRPPAGGVASPRRPHHPGADGWRRQRSPPRLTRNHDQKPNKRMDEGR